MLRKLFLFIFLPAFGALLWQNYELRERIIKEVKEIRNLMNNYGQLVEPWQLIFLTAGFTLLFLLAWDFLFKEEPLLKRIKKTFFRVLKRLPIIGASIKNEINKAKRELAKSEAFKMKSGVKHYLKLPEKGLSGQEVVRHVTDLKATAGANWDKGFVSGTVYNGSQELTDLISQIYRISMWSNPLHADVFPDARQLEIEAIQMCVGMFHGGDDAGGILTSGGTESILMAMKAYRDIAYERGISRPEILCGESAHSAFDKAAGYFGMKIVRVPVVKTTRMCDLKALRNAITSSTIVMVASAPGFPHGIIDPIEEMATMASRKGIYLHVDCCLGGFLLPFMEEAGFPIGPFDFRVKGVTSISCDTHKYGFCPKGSSVILYSSKNIRKYQFFVAPDWQGGIYASPSVAGSRPGALAVCTWATMVHIGRAGYVESTKKVIKTARYITAELKKIPEIYILGNPEVSVIGIGSTEFDIYRLSSGLGEKGWNINSLQFPSSIHICLTLLHTQVCMRHRTTIP